MNRQTISIAQTLHWQRQRKPYLHTHAPRQITRTNSEAPALIYREKLSGAPNSSKEYPPSFSRGLHADQKKSLQSDLVVEQDFRSAGAQSKTPASAYQAKLITPKALLKKNSALFSARIILACLIIFASSFLMLSGGLPGFLVGLIIQGAMYVHLIELQHSVLHLHAFESHIINRAIGILLGVPMFISFSDFQYRHLRHHKHLGTALNSETFSYQHSRLDSLKGFLKAMFDYSRFLTIRKRLWLAITAKDAISDGLNPLMEKRIVQEYRFFALLLLAVATTSMLTADLRPLLVWLAPLVAAEPVHFLLELPEHFALKAHSNPNVFENTRSWGGSLFARWFSHNTNYHTAHHFNQLVPMHRLPELQKIIGSRIPAASYSKSYPDFYFDVIRGLLKAEDGD